MGKLIRKLRFKIYMMLTGVYLAVALLGVLLLWLLTPPQYFAVYPSIDVFYWLCGVGMTFFLDRVRCNDGRVDRLLSVFMLFRGIKFLLTILILVIGVKAMALPKVPFVVSLMSNYFIYSALELYIYHRFNKKITTCKWR